MKNVKRILALVLALSLLLCCFPASMISASAAEVVTANLPTATVTKLEKDDLTFAMNFKADEVTDEQLAYYGKWFADFELTVNKETTFDANGSGDGYLAGQYDGEWTDENWAWSGEWVNVPFKEPVTLEANKPLKIMAFAAESLNEPGLKYTFKEVYEVVKDFDCGVYFTPEFLDANPDLRVTLELKIYNPVDESVNHVIGETYVFTNEFIVAYNVQTGKNYNTVSGALKEAVSGQTVRLIRDANDNIITVLDGITLDLNGHSLEAVYVFATGNVVDDSTGNKGKLKAASKMVLSENNRQLPVEDANGKVAFYEVLNVVHAIAEQTETSVKYAFQTKFEAAAHEALLAGNAATKVKIVVRATWTRVDGTTGVQDFVYNDTWTEMFINSYVASSGKYNKMFTLVLNGYQNYENLKYQAYVISDYAPSFTVDKANTQDVNLTNEAGSTAFVPSGAMLRGGQSSLTLQITDVARSSSNITLLKDETQKSVDVHVNGLSQNNTVPVIVKVKGLVEAGFNNGNLKLYHIENNKANLMTQVSSVAEVDKHNEFYYDVTTGDVTMALATFSEISAIANTANYWDGTVDTSWYDNNPDADVFEIFSAHQLAGFGQLVDSGIDFEGKTVNMRTNVNLKGEGGKDMLFNPIGYGYVHLGGKPFRGTFDGNGRTITGLYQHGWDMEAESKNGEDYTYSIAGGGLFASVANATIKNVNISGANIVMECVDMGILVGYSQGNCTYENIGIYNSKIANYQRATGGVVGEVSPIRNSDGSLVAPSNTHTFKNIHVGFDVVVGSLWGDFDAPVGGVLGARWDDDNTTNVIMEDVVVACRLDVYNDITSAYRWHAYRRAGMLIGNTDTPAANGKTAQTATAYFLTCKNVMVHWGDWVNYTYCQFTNSNNPGVNYPWVRVQAGENCSAYSNPRYGQPLDLNGNVVTNANHVHKEGDTCGLSLPFGQLYGGGQGVYGAVKHDGVSFSTPVYTITYLNGTDVDEIFYVTDNTQPYNLKNPGAGMQWLDKEGQTITQIPAGNKTSIVVVLDEVERLYAHFVDIDGIEIAAVEFTKNQTEIIAPPVPVIEGYDGRWEHFDLPSSVSIVVKPVYTLKDQTTNELYQVTDINDLFEKLSNGESLVMSQELSGGQSNASKKECAVITKHATDKSARLNLNGYKLQYNFASNANKQWKIFDIKVGSTFELSGGVYRSGTLHMELDALNGNASAIVFDLDPGATLVLEKGVIIELHYKEGMQSQISMFGKEGVQYAFNQADYPNIKYEHDEVNNIKRITVLETTVMVG